MPQRRAKGAAKAVKGATKAVTGSTRRTESVNVPRAAEPTAAAAAAAATPLTETRDLPREIQVETDWAALLDAEPPQPELQQIGDHEVWLMNLFSADECTRLLAAAESHGFGATNYPKSYRGNLRLLTTDQGFADAVWMRLRAQVPRELALDGSPWVSYGLNECWRLAKYHPGDRFQGHCDAAFMRTNGDMSMFTVNIYMNEGFEGGRTRFYFKDTAQSTVSGSAFAVTPRAGLCLLFRQPPGKLYYHDGEQLGSGLKYLFRSDVMYRRTEVEEQSSEDDRLDLDGLETRLRRRGD